MRISLHFKHLNLECIYIKFFWSLCRIYPQSVAYQKLHRVALELRILSNWNRLVAGCNHIAKVTGSGFLIKSLYIKVGEAERVSDLPRSKNITALVKKAQQLLYFLRIVRKANTLNH